ncbi:MAG: hypothetical protein J6X36_01765 [Lachnospiraceae bacterium]|nr:hypothetical protein [Lachnospiraceae bacterium]
MIVIAVVGYKAIMIRLFDNDDVSFTEIRKRAMTDTEAIMAFPLNLIAADNKFTIKAIAVSQKINPADTLTSVSISVMLKLFSLETTERNKVPAENNIQNSTVYMISVNTFLIS